MGKKQKGRGRILLQSLTADQIEVLLEVMFQELDREKVLGALKKADAEIAETVTRILDSSTDVDEHILPSDQKNIEAWNELWGRWHDVVDKVGDEHGKYALQEEHWEPPSFDGSAVASDLEEIAEEMLTLIDRIFPLVKDPSLFIEELKLLDSQIHEYPEWMGVECYEGCSLLKSTTRSVLTWQWLCHQNDRLKGKSFIEVLLMLKNSLTMIKLDDNEVTDFLTHLPEDTCREIYDSLSGDEFEKEVKDVNSLFHTINHLFEERFDKDRYLGSCKTNLESNWHYGKPLIEDALARQDYKAAVSYLEKTFEILLSRSGKDAWKPESALMLDYLCFNYKLIHQEVEELLDMWISAEERLENRKKADLLRMQSVTLRNPTDWETVINEYALLQGVEPFPAIDSLLSLWKTEMAKRSAREIKDGQILADSWIGWLIDAKLDNNGECFGEKLEHWLHSLMKDTHKFSKEYPLIELLTHDLNSEKFLESKLVRIFSDVFNRHYGYEELAHHRISALEQYGIRRHIPTILSIWRNCASRMVPDPEKMGGYGYTGCAAWMKLLHELNPDEYRRLLSKWKLKHQRRRNLWRDMRSLNLPV